MDEVEVETVDGRTGAAAFEHHEAHGPDTGSCCLGCRAALDRIEHTLDRLGPLIDTLEQAAPLFAGMAGSKGDGNGKPPGAFKMAMAASRLARGKEA